MNQTKLDALRQLYATTTKGNWWVFDDQILSDKENEMASAMVATTNPKGLANAEMVAELMTYFPDLLALSYQALAQKENADKIPEVDARNIASRLQGYSGSLSPDMLEPVWDVTTNTGDISNVNGAAFFSPENLDDWANINAAATAICYMMNNLPAIADLVLRGAYAPKLNELRLRTARDTILAFFQGIASEFYSDTQAPSMQNIQLRVTGDFSINADDSISSDIAEVVTGSIELHYTVLLHDMPIDDMNHFVNGINASTPAHINRVTYDKPAYEVGEIATITLDFHFQFPTNDTEIF